MPVSIDAILEALCELDGDPRNPPGGKPQRRAFLRRARRPPEGTGCEIRLPGRCTPAAERQSETIRSMRHVLAPKADIALLISHVRSARGPWIHPSSLQSGIIDHPLIAYLNKLAREILQLVLPISSALSR